MAVGSNAAESERTRGNLIGWGISLAFEMSVSWSWVITEAIPNSKIEAGEKAGHSRSLKYEASWLRKRQ